MFVRVVRPCLLLGVVLWCFVVCCGCFIVGVVWCWFMFGAAHTLLASFGVVCCCLCVVGCLLLIDVLLVVACD